MFLAAGVSTRMTVLVWNMLFASCIPGTIVKWYGVCCLLLPYPEYDDGDMEYLVCGEPTKIVVVVRSLLFTSCISLRIAILACTMLGDRDVNIDAGTLFTLVYPGG